MSSEVEREWQIENRKNVFSGYYKVDELNFSHSVFKGGVSQQANREIFIRGNVCAVLPHDPKTDQLVLVEQFRIGAMHQQPHPWLLEVIAGMIEPGETPEAVAVRESFEEAGLSLNAVEPVAQYLASPGCSTEEVFIYYSQTDLSEAGGLHGLEEEGEDIRVHVLAVDDAFAMLESGEIKNAISIIALQWFQNKRLKAALGGGGSV